MGFKTETYKILIHYRTSTLTQAKNKQSLQPLGKFF
jgi:hypothetical protein